MKPLTMFATLALLTQIASPAIAARAPQLAINQHSNGEILVSWPLNTNGFHVEQTLSVAPPANWKRVQDAPFVNEDRLVLRLHPDERQAFFRLTQGRPYNFSIPTAPGQHQLALIDQGRVRTYQLIIPASYSAGSPTPLAFIFHGSGQSASAFISLHPALLAKANQEGLILVVPDGTVNPVNGKLSWATNPHVQRGIDDVVFAQNLLAEVSGTLTINPRRVYAAGFSNGGVMSHTLAHSTEGMIAAIVPIGASIGYTDQTNGNVYLPDPPTQPVAAMIVNGRLDPTRPWDGGINNKGTLMASVGDAVDYWVDGNPCIPVSMTNIIAGGTVEKTRYPNCSNNTEVVLVDLKLADHIWPDASDGVNFDANVETIDFFLAHQLPAISSPTNSPIPTTAGTYELSFADQGYQRTFRIQIPTNYNPTNETPIAMVFHGGGQSAASFSALHPALFSKCDQEGFILVLPDATVNPVNGVNLWAANPYHTHVDDIAFVENLLRHLNGDLNLDRNRVYGAGFSNGASFCHYLAANTTNLVAAIAPVGSVIGWNDPLTQAIILPPPTMNSLPVLMINGLLDAKRPFHGGPNIDGIDKASAQDSVDFWTAANACLPVSNTVSRAMNTVRITTYDQCNGTTEVILAAVGRMEHAWPDAADGWGYDANEEVIEFFKRH